MQTKKKVLIGGLGSLAVAAGVAMTGGTSAYFYDLEMSQGNKLAACSLDLVAKQPTIEQTLDGSPGGSTAAVAISVGPQAAGGSSGSGQWEAPFVGGLYSVNIGGMEPGDEFKVTIPVDNAGTCAGELWGDLRGPFKDLEGVQYEPETNWQNAPWGSDPDKQSVADAESAAILAQQPSSGLNPVVIDQYDGGAGDLDNVVLVKYGLDEAGNQLTYNETFSEFAWRKPTMMDPSFVPGDNTKNIVVMLKVPDSGSAGDGNEIMGDSFEFLIDLALAQPGKLTAGNVDAGLPSLTAPSPAP